MMKAEDQAALVVPCPVCGAFPGAPCTQPTNTGRKPVWWTHLKRNELAAEERMQDRAEARAYNEEV